LEPSFGHPGRYAPSRADPQISSIARDAVAISDEEVNDICHRVVSLLVRYYWP
jgi:hypothetical protein